MSINVTASYSGTVHDIIFVISVNIRPLDEMGYNRFNDIKYRRKSEKGEKRNFTDEARTIVKLGKNKKRESISLLQYECCSDRNVMTKSGNSPNPLQDAIGSGNSSSGVNGSNNEFFYEVNTIVMKQQNL